MTNGEYMSYFGSKLRRFALLGAVGAVLMLVMPGAVSADPAGGPGPDGRQGGSGSEATEARAATECGADVRTRFVTEDAPSATTASSFLGFASNGVTVAANTTRCLLVEFTGETACVGDTGTADDFCYLRAIANGVEMLPMSGGFLAFSSEHGTSQSNSARWLRRVSGASNHTTYTVTLQRKTDGLNTQFNPDDWRFSLTGLA